LAKKNFDNYQDTPYVCEKKKWYVLKTAQSVFSTVGLSQCYMSVWIIFMKFET